jgi:hypothetical protein
MIDSVSSCPLLVNLYSTRGGISLYDFLLKIPFFSNSFKRIANVLLLKPFIEFLNVIYLTGELLQQSGISISRVPLFVINFLNCDVSFIKLSISYPWKSHVSSTVSDCLTGNFDNSFGLLIFLYLNLNCSFVSPLTLTFHYFS